MATPGRSDLRARRGFMVHEWVSVARGVATLLGATLADASIDTLLSGCITLRARPALQLLKELELAAASTEITEAELLVLIRTGVCLARITPLHHAPLLAAEVCERLCLPLLVQRRQVAQPELAGAMVEAVCVSASELLSMPGAEELRTRVREHCLLKLGMASADESAIGGEEEDSVMALPKGQDHLPRPSLGEHGSELGTHAALALAHGCQRGASRCEAVGKSLLQHAARLVASAGAHRRELRAAALAALEAELDAEESAAEGVSEAASAQAAVEEALEA